MKTQCSKPLYLCLAACSGAALVVVASGTRTANAEPASHDGAKTAHAKTLVPVPPGGVHPVPPVVAPPNCAAGFSQTSVSGQPGGAPFGFSCRYQVTCPPGTQSLQSILQVSGNQTGPTTAVFTYSCSYLTPTVK